MRLTFDSPIECVSPHCISQKELTRLNQLIEKLTECADEYGIGAPHTSVYGVDGALTATQRNIRDAVRTAMNNFGLDPEEWVIYSFPVIPYQQFVEKQYQAWRVHIRLLPQVSDARRKEIESE